MTTDNNPISVSNEYNHTDILTSFEQEEGVRPFLPDVVEQLIPSEMKSEDLLHVSHAPPDFPQPNQPMPMTKITNHLLQDEGFVINLAWDVSIQEHLEAYRMKQAFKDAAQLLVDSICSKVEHTVVCYHKDTVIAESTTSLFVVNYALLKQSYEESCQTSKLRTEYAKHNFSQDLHSLYDSEESKRFVISDTQRKLFNIQIGENVTNAHLCFINLTDASYDLVGCCLHELTETMGRISPFQRQDPMWQGEEEEGKDIWYRSIMDLGNYVAEKKRNKIQFHPQAYFTTNNGKTQLGFLNKNVNGDSMDWDSESHPHDCFKASSKPNIKESLTFEDLVLLEILGFDLMPITYPFGNSLTLPVDAKFQFPIFNNYQPQKSYSSNNRVLFSLTDSKIFSISPNLPDGLIFDTQLGTISGQTNIPIEKTLFTVKIDLLDSNISGSFYLTIETNPNYELKKKRDMLLKKFQELQKGIKDGTIKPHAGEIESSSDLTTADIVIIVLFSVVLLLVLVGLGIFIHDHVKNNSKRNE